MDRQKVYDAIEVERSYQNMKWGEQREPMRRYIALMKSYLNKAESYYGGGEDTNAMNALLEVTSLGVAAMENHGIKPRKLAMPRTVQLAPWVYVDSTSISAIRYISSTRTLDIRFVNGGQYSYANVPSDVYNMFRTARSKGAFYQRNIKEIYRSTKVY